MKVRAILIIFELNYFQANFIVAMPLHLVKEDANSLQLCCQNVKKVFEQV